MNYLDKQRKQGRDSIEILRTEAKKQVARYIKRKYSGNNLGFIAGDVFVKVQEPYRLWIEQGNQLETETDYRHFIRFAKALPLSNEQKLVP